MLPLYLLADDESNEYIIRTQFPRFIGRIVPDDEALAQTVLDLGTGEAVEIVQWIDPPQPDAVMLALTEEIKDALDKDMERDS